jgi:hypothetical protein
MEVWIIPELWAIIKSFLLEDEWKWKFREVVKELPKAIYMHLSTVRVCRAPINLTIRKRFQKLNFFENHLERLISICYVDRVVPLVHGGDLDYISTNIYII